MRGLSLVLATLGLILALYLFYFAKINSQLVTLDFGFRGTMMEGVPVWVLTLGSAVGGFLIGVLLMLPWNVGAAWRIRRAEGQLRQVRASLEEERKLRQTEPPPVATEVASQPKSEAD